MIERGRRASLFPFKECPFCNCTLADIENDSTLTGNDNDRVKISKRLQKHIGDHLLNFSLLALLKPEENDNNLGSDVMNIQDSSSNSVSSPQHFDHGLSETDDLGLTTQEQPHRGRVTTTDVPDLESDVDWETVVGTIRKSRRLPELPEMDPKLETFVEKSRNFLTNLETVPRNRFEGTASMEVIDQAISLPEHQLISKDEDRRLRERRLMDPKNKDDQQRRGIKLLLEEVTINGSIYYVTHVSIGEPPQGR